MCYFGCEKKKKDFVWFNCHGFPVSPGEKKKKKTIKAIQICYIKAVLAALLLDSGVFPQMRIHLDPHHWLIEPRCWLSRSSSDAVQPVGVHIKAPAELHAGSDVLRTLRGAQVWLCFRLVYLFAESWLFSRSRAGQQNQQCKQNLGADSSGSSLNQHENAPNTRGG